MQKKRYKLPFVHQLRMWWLGRKFSKLGTKAQRKVFNLLDKNIYKNYLSPWTRL